MNPVFPAIAGTEQFPMILKNRIAEVAWEKANGDQDEFTRLCFRHIRGEIDLFADRPAETDATARIRAQQTIQDITEPPPAAPAAEAAPIVERAEREQEE